MNLYTSLENYLKEFEQYPKEIKLGAALCKYIVCHEGASLMNKLTLDMQMNSGDLAYTLISQCGKKIMRCTYFKEEYEKETIQ